MQLFLLFIYLSSLPSELSFMTAKNQKSKIMVNPNDIYIRAYHQNQNLEFQFWETSFYCLLILQDTFVKGSWLKNEF